MACRMQLVNVDGSAQCHFSLSHDALVAGRDGARSVLLTNLSAVNTTDPRRLPGKPAADSVRLLDMFDVVVPAQLLVGLMLVASVAMVVHSKLRQRSEMRSIASAAVAPSVSHEDLGLQDAPEQGSARQRTAAHLRSEGDAEAVTDSPTDGVKDFLSRIEIRTLAPMLMSVRQIMPNAMQQGMVGVLLMRVALNSFNYSRKFSEFVSADEGMPSRPYIFLQFVVVLLEFVVQAGSLIVIIMTLVRFHMLPPLPMPKKLESRSARREFAPVAPAEDSGLARSRSGVEATSGPWLVDPRLWEATEWENCRKHGENLDLMMTAIRFAGSFSALKILNTDRIISQLKERYQIESANMRESTQRNRSGHPLPGAIQDLHNGGKRLLAGLRLFGWFVLFCVVPVALGTISFLIKIRSVNAVRLMFCDVHKPALIELRALYADCLRISAVNSLSDFFLLLIPCVNLSFSYEADGRVAGVAKFDELFAQNIDSCLTFSQSIYGENGAIVDGYSWTEMMLFSVSALGIINNVCGINNPGQIRTSAVLDFVFAGGDSHLESFEIEHRDTFKSLVFSSVLIYNKAEPSRSTLWATVAILMQMDASSYGQILIKEYVEGKDRGEYAHIRATKLGLHKARPLAQLHAENEFELLNKRLFMSFVEAVERAEQELNLKFGKSYFQRFWPMAASIQDYEECHELLSFWVETGLEAKIKAAFDNFAGYDQELGGMDPEARKAGVRFIDEHAKAFMALHVDRGGLCEMEHVEQLEKLYDDVADRDVELVAAAENARLVRRAAAKAQMARDWAPDGPLTRSWQKRSGGALPAVQAERSRRGSSEP